MLTFISCLVYLSFILVGIGVYVYYHFSSWVESDVDLRFFVPDYGYVEDECGCGVVSDED